ncbi:MAG TPA: protein kinase [Pyrinomonadaceae bacterium]|nr:protein kinase [Pyrinomonadaceae bacterium]
MMVDQFLGQVIAGKYRVDAFIRQSDNGPIFRGRHIAVDRPVTIKLLDPALGTDDTAVMRFEFEARSEARIIHPNVLNVTDVGSDGLGTHYVIYEPVVGTTLDGILAAESKLDPMRAAGIAHRAAEGLSAAHAQNVLHRNLAPANILVDESNADAVKIFNFGSQPTDGHERYRPSDLRYAAPEIINGEEGDARSDVYSLGVVLYQMLAGELPFDTTDEFELTRMQTEEPPPPMSAFRKDLPAELETVVFKALAKDPDMRQQSAAEFANELTASVGLNSSGLAAAAGHDIWKTAFVVIVGILLLSAVLIYATYTKQTDPTTQLQSDANGQPVQPLNPATGTQEESLASLPANSAEIMTNSNMAVPPGTLPGGDGYNPWANGGAPPPGAPPQTYVAPGGQIITIDPNNPSQFMPAEGGVILVPVPANANTAKPTPSPKTPAANANAATPPAANTAVPKVSPTPAAKASPTPAAAKPAGTPGKQPAKPAPTKPSDDIE